jgi:hypothetical protein
MSTTYKRPKTTYTDTLTKNAITDYLKDYQEVTNADDLKLGTHVRYFTMENNKKKFRLGGYVIKIQPEYIVLSNKRYNDNSRSTWSVQRKNSILFKQMTNQEIRDEYEQTKKELQKEYEKIIQKKDEEIERLKSKLINSRKSVR